MTEALLNKYGTQISFDGKNLWAMWSPDDLVNVPEEELRGLKIGYRAKFIKRLSADFENSIIDENKLRNLEKEVAEIELNKLYGVGPETARILLFEALHRFDTFKHVAPWQQKIYSRLFYGKDLVHVDDIRKDIIETYGEKYAMLAVHYIWEDIFWRRKNEHIEWLEKEMRL
jgi:N-glycosylase/DNA lyase